MKKFFLALMLAFAALPSFADRVDFKAVEVMQFIYNPTYDDWFEYIPWTRCDFDVIFMEGEIEILTDKDPFHLEVTAFKQDGETFCYKVRESKSGKILDLFISQVKDNWYLMSLWIDTVRNDYKLYLIRY